MAEGKSAYYGPYEQGIGTILRDEGKGFLDYALQLPMIKAKQAAAQEKKIADIYKEIKPGDAWRRFQPSITSEWSRLSNTVASSIRSGTFSRGDLSRTVGELHALENMSTQLQNDVDLVVKDYMADKRIKDSATEEFTNRVVGDGSLKQLHKSAASTLDPDYFLVEKGGSKHINTEEAMNHVLKNNFNEWLQKKVTDVGQEEALRRGLIKWDEYTNSYKLKSYLDRDANGNITVKDVNELDSAGVLSIFENDPYMNRVLIDAAEDYAKINGRTTASRDDKSLALYTMLKGREVGEMTDERRRRTASYFVESSSGSRTAESGSWLYQRMQALGQGQGPISPNMPGIKSELAPEVRPLGGLDNILEGKKLGDKEYGLMYLDSEGKLMVNTKVPGEEDTVEIRTEPVNTQTIFRLVNKATFDAFIEAAKKDNAIDASGNLIFKFPGNAKRGALDVPNKPSTNTFSY